MCLPPVFTFESFSCSYGSRVCPLCSCLSLSLAAVVHMSAPRVHVCVILLQLWFTCLPPVFTFESFCCSCGSRVCPLCSCLSHSVAAVVHVSAPCVHVCAILLQLWFTCLPPVFTFESFCCSYGSRVCPLCSRLSCHASSSTSS